MKKNSYWNYFDVLLFVCINILCFFKLFLTFDFDLNEKSKLIFNKNKRRRKELIYLSLPRIDKYFRGGTCRFRKGKTTKNKLTIVTSIRTSSITTTTSTKNSTSRIMISTIRSTTIEAVISSRGIVVVKPWVGSSQNHNNNFHVLDSLWYTLFCLLKTLVILDK